MKKLSKGRVTFPKSNPCVMLRCTLHDSEGARAGCVQDLGADATWSVR